MKLTLAVCLALVTFSLSPSPRGLVAAAEAAEAKGTLHCPMHPAIKQDRPGDCPICGMKLVPVERPDAKGASAALRVSPEQQRTLGVVVAPVEKSASSRKLRALGRVQADEGRVYRVNAGTDGSIREVGSATTGSRVRKGQLLADFYAPSAIGVIQLYLLNHQASEKVAKARVDGTQDVQGQPAVNANFQQRVIQLENLGVSARQRAELDQTRRMPETIQIYSPADGFVLARTASPGMKFDRGFELYKIADLRKVWVIADVFMHEAQHVKEGMHATVTLPEQGASWTARVKDLLPQFDGASRTLKARLEVDNPDLLLRPDMFVDVSFHLQLPPSVVVPAGAVIDSGLSRTVFVQSGEGRFEARRVETGWRHDDRIEIVKGLSPGEVIVTSGTFFLDSESRMRPPASGAAAAPGATPAPTGNEHREHGGAGPSPSEREARGGARGEATKLAGSAR